jgi:hypothetical protein
MSMDRRNVIASALAAVAVIAGSGCTETVDRTERGNELYSYCEQCHGVEGEGNEAFAPRSPVSGLVRRGAAREVPAARGDRPDDAGPAHASDVRTSRRLPDPDRRRARRRDGARERRTGDQGASPSGQTL